MPFYRYSVQDRSGQRLDGTISAKTQDEASFALSQRGFRIVQIQDIRSQAAPSKVHQPVQASGPVESVKTRPGSDKALFFLFSQLASLLRSGVNPHVGLSSLANQTRHAGYRTSLEDMARTVGSGGSMSSVMERYPYLYPPDVSGTVKAGELGGFLPEACLAVANQKEAAHRLAFRLKVFVTLAIMLISVFPVSYGVIQGSLATIKRQDAAGGSLPPVQTLLEELGKSLPAMIPPTLLAAALLASLYIGWNTMPMRKFRHAIALYMPVFAGRAQAEAMARLAWAMQHLSRAGLPPNVVFRHAAETVPNVVLRDRLVEQSQTMQEQERLSEGLRRARVLPEEHEIIVQNGELVGDVPGALGTVASAHDAELKSRDSTMIYKFGCILYPVIGLMVVALAYILFKTFYMGIQETILGE